MTESAKNETLRVKDDSILYIGPTIKTVEEVLEQGNFSLDEWTIVSAEAGSWQTPIKVDKGETVKVINLWRVSVKLKRHIEDVYVKAIENFKKSLKDITLPSFPTSKNLSGLLLEISLYDCHFGKACIDGNSTAKLKDIYVRAVQEAIEKTSLHQIEEVLIPIGNDFFDVNDWTGRTVKGTQVETDSSFPEMFETGLSATTRAIYFLLDKTEAKIIIKWIPGNHDYHSSWHLCVVLREIFSTTDRVDVQIGSTSIDYHFFGRVFLMFYHGDKIKDAELALFAATDKPKQWARAKWREAHIGHKHFKQLSRHLDINEEKGFSIRRMPSLCGTNKWHYENGFIGTRQSADALLWHPDGYLVAEYPIYTSNKP